MKVKFGSILFFTIFFMACVTVNIYFPAAKVEKAAEEIVKEVRQQSPKKEQKLKKEEKSPPESELHKWQFVNCAYAQEGVLEVSTASIRALKTAIKKRFPKLIPYFQKGIIGENNRGLLEIKSWQGVSLAKRAKVKQLVEAENKDRTNLYQEVAKNMGIDPSQLGKVQKIFAKQWQKTAPSGTWIQTEDGKWVRK
ncbi:Uncharacterized conserved protein UCP025560 [Candidatus Desulfofervidus auxilii]|uniref:Uncharacterized conserved protein UCP025560 n=1 Tax=Desulfofervidus auxilii TaxID=1621989 RepID=A0A7U4QM11_DESA2|nr:YdbL family protein [Candidatus Desulfofervidus auxilii]AMM41831.1 Uncharacterized conserved protein UCP025560 [Candidatus Desulfofervidus auxilii]